MRKEFFATARWQMKLPDRLSGVAGGVIMPSGIALHSVERRKLDKKYPHMARRLFDPQLYLAGINPVTSRKACANLATYPWFPIKKDFPYDSSKLTQAEWKDAVTTQIHKAWTGAPPTGDHDVSDAVRLCLDLQKRLGVQALLLPAPLTSDLHGDLDLEMEWLEQGLRLAPAVAPELPVYASIALSDTALRTVDPWSSPLLDALLDQVSARGVSRVYLVLEQASEDGYYCTNERTLGALLRLSNGFKHAGAEHVLVAFAGMAGLVALAAGADAWASGWLRSERRLKLSDLEDQEGRTTPAYYSHPMAGEFHVEEDLAKAVQRGLLPRLRDETEASAGLLTALAAGKSVSSVPEWEHRMGNKTASIEHFLRVCVRETEALSGREQSEIETSTGAWLNQATELANDVYSIGSLKARTAVNHQAAWLAAFQKYERNKLKF
jgi:hypothetical protein